MPKRKGLLAVVLVGVLWAAGVGAAPQRVRLPEESMEMLGIKPRPASLRPACPGTIV
jgi:hypothetical protein